METPSPIIRTSEPVLVKLVEMILFKWIFLRWWSFLLGSLAVTFIVLLFWIHFFPLVFFIYNGSRSMGKFWSCYCLSFHWLFVKFQRGCSSSSSSLWQFLCWLISSSWSLRDILWDDISKLKESTDVSKLCGWVQVGIDVYIPHCKYQVKPD